MKKSKIFTARRGLACAVALVMIFSSFVTGFAAANTGVGVSLVTGKIQVTIPENEAGKQLTMLAFPAGEEANLTNQGVIKYINQLPSEATGIGGSSTGVTVQFGLEEADKGKVITVKTGGESFDAATSDDIYVPFADGLLADILAKYTEAALVTHEDNQLEITVEPAQTTVPGNVYVDVYSKKDAGEWTIVSSNTTITSADPGSYTVKVVVTEVSLIDNSVVATKTSGEFGPYLIVAPPDVSAVKVNDATVTNMITNYNKKAVADSSATHEPTDLDGFRTKLETTPAADGNFLVIPAKHFTFTFAKDTGVTVAFNVYRAADKNTLDGNIVAGTVYSSGTDAWAFDLNPDVTDDMYYAISGITATNTAGTVSVPQTYYFKLIYDADAEEAPTIQFVVDSSTDANGIQVVSGDGGNLYQTATFTVDLGASDEPDTMYEYQGDADILVLYSPERSDNGVNGDKAVFVIYAPIGKTVDPANIVATNTKASELADNVDKNKYVLIYGAVDSNVAYNATELSSLHLLPQINIIFNGNTSYLLIAADLDGNGIVNSLDLLPSINKIFNAMPCAAESK